MPSLVSTRIKMASRKALFTSLFVALGALAGCLSQGNGDRCDPFASNAGNDDCGNDPNLSCVSVGSPAGTVVYACCPNKNTNIQGQGLCAVTTYTGLDAAPPVTTGDAATDAGAPDASVDATLSDATTDSGSDAALDASSPDADGADASDTADGAAVDAGVDAPVDSGATG